MPSKRSYDVAFHLGAAALSAYRSRGGSTTQTMRRNSNLPVLTEAGEYTRKNRKSGRYKRRTLKNLYRLMGAAQQSFWYRYSGMNRWNSTDGGNYKMYNHLTTGTQSIEILPMHLFDLTCLPNKNGASTTLNPNPHWAAVRGTVSANGYQWNLLNGRNSGGTVANGWQNENVASVDGGIQASFRSSVLKYSDIRFMCYGTLTVPIKWDISIVSFPDDNYNPMYPQVQYSTTGAWSSSNNSYVLLDELAAPYSSNPLNIQDPKMKAKIIYHFRENFVIQPGSTTDAGATIPHYREVKIFKKWDRMLRFDYADPSASDPQNPQTFQRNDATNWPTCIWPARRFLLIRATSGYSTTGGSPVFTTSINPSYDLMIRNKWSITI